MSQTALEAKTTFIQSDEAAPMTVDERLARIDRAMPLPRKSPTLYRTHLTSQKGAASLLIISLMKQRLILEVAFAKVLSKFL
jgi:hypothetical protein